MPAIPQCSNGHPMTEDRFLVALGCYNGIVASNHFGSNPVVGTSFEIIREAGGTHTWLTRRQSTKRPRLGIMIRTRIRELKRRQAVARQNRGGYALSLWWARQRVLPIALGIVLAIYILEGISLI